MTSIKIQMDEQEEVTPQSKYGIGDPWNILRGALLLWHLNKLVVGRSLQFEGEEYKLVHLIWPWDKSKVYFFNYYRQGMRTKLMTQVDACLVSDNGAVTYSRMAIKTVRTNRLHEPFNLVEFCFLRWYNWCV